MLRSLHSILFLVINMCFSMASRIPSVYQYCKCIQYWLPLFEFPGAHDEPWYTAGQRSWHLEVSIRIRIFWPYPDPSLRSYLDPEIQAVSGSGYSDRIQIRIIWPYPGISVVSGFGYFGNIRIQVFQTYPVTGILAVSRSGYLIRSRGILVLSGSGYSVHIRIRVFWPYPDPSIFALSGSGYSVDIRIRVFC